MEGRLSLDSMLKAELSVFKNLHYYFQPPENLKIEYPAIIYKLDGIDDHNADDKVYRRKHRYALTYVSNDPDDPLVDIIDGLRYCHLDRAPYVADNLYHYPFTIYF